MKKVLIVLGLLILMFSVNSTETINTWENTKTSTFKDITITSPYNIVCEWRDPADDFKYCSVIIEVENSNAVHDYIEKDYPLAKFKHKASNISVYTSKTFTLYDKQILNRTCYANLTRKEKQNDSLCRYNVTRRAFSDWKLKTKLDKVPKGGVLGIKLEFTSPTLISAGTYLKNQFNFTMFGDYNVSLDPDISACATLSTAGATYNLIADIINSSVENCINITANDITFDGQGHLIDGDSNVRYAISLSRGSSTNTNAVIKNCRITDWSGVGNGRAIQLYYADNNTLYNLQLDSNYPGIHLEQSNNNTIYNSSFSSNTIGIKCWYCKNNIIANNTFSDNSFRGIYLAGPENNSFYNNFFNNTDNVGIDTPHFNFWNTTKTLSTNIVGDPYIGGNFWATPTGTGFSETCNDTNKTGICDSSYTLETDNIDYLPLSGEYSRDTTPPTYSDNSTNSTIAGSNIEHRLKWHDMLNATTQGNLSGYIFSWHNGANWTSENTTNDLESGTIQYKGETGGNLTEGFEESFPPEGWQTGGNANWFKDSSTFNSGLYSAGSGDINDSQNTWLNITKTYSSNSSIEFYWKVSSESDYDYLHFYIDGSEKTKISGSVNWVKLSYNVTVGTHEFKWMYTKDDSVSSEPDMGWIDDVTFVGLGLNDTEASKSHTTYNDVLSEDLLDTIKNITVIVDVSYYGNSGSTANSNNNPDLWLEIYNGTDWIEIGNMSVSSTGNVSKLITESTVLSAWTTQTKRDISVKGVYFDYKDSTHYDEINYTDVWVKINSEGEFLNDSWTPFPGTPTNESWSNVTKTVTSTIGATIKWQVFANDSYNNWNHSPIYSYITTAILTIPTPVTPVNATNMTNNTPYLEWINSTGIGVANYQVQISDSLAFTNINYSANVTVNHTTMGLMTDNIYWYWRVRANTTQFNSNWSETYQFGLDNTEPSIKYDQGTLSSGSYNGNITINITASDITTGINTISIYVNTVLAKNCSSTNCYLNRLYADGTYVFNATANDTLGNLNASLSSRTVTIDNTYPNVTILYPANNSALAASTTNFVLKANTTENCSCRYSKTFNTPYSSMTDFTDTGNTTHSVKLTDYTDGSHWLYVKCNDSVGNIRENWALFSIKRAGTTGHETNGGVTKPKEFSLFYTDYDLFGLEKDKEINLPLYIMNPFHNEITVNGKIDKNLTTCKWIISKPKWSASIIVPENGNFNVSAQNFNITVPMITDYEECFIYIDYEHNEELQTAKYRIEFEHTYKQTVIGFFLMHITSRSGIKLYMWQVIFGFGFAFMLVILLYISRKPLRVRYNRYVRTLRK